MLVALVVAGAVWGGAAAGAAAAAAAGTARIGMAALGAGGSYYPGGGCWGIFFVLVIATSQWQQ